MSKDTKSVYTEEVCADMREQYTAEEGDEGRKVVVSAFANRLGVNVASVRAKMVREGYYVAKTPTDKNGEKTETKEEIVTTIETIMGVNPDSLPGLEKANKPTLKAVRAALRAAAEVVFDESESAEDVADSETVTV